MEWRHHADDSDAAAASRRLFVEFLRLHCSPESDCESAETAFGELIANAILHAPGPIDIHVHDCERGFVTLDVYDTGVAFTATPNLPSLNTESGRGLYIISKICPRMNLTRTERGNKVSVTLPVSAKRRGLA